MIEILYYFTIFSCLVIGMLLLMIKTAPRSNDKHYRIAKRYLGIASITVALGNAAILVSRIPGEQVEILSAPVLIVSQLQAALFTFLVLTLFHSDYVCRRNILRNLAPTFVFTVLYVLSLLLFSDIQTHTASIHFRNFSNPTLVLRTIFGLVYLFQIVLYVRLFRRERKIYIAGIENYFSDTQKYNLNWAVRLFYQATVLGLTVFIFSIAPSRTFDAVLTIVITYLYFYFSVRYINFQYRLYNTLPAVENRCTETESGIKPQEAVESQQFDQSFENTLVSQQLFLQQGVVLADYASRLGISERKLSCYINSTYGCSFKRWINIQRIEYAKNLIDKNPEMTIDNVGEQSGFADKSQFSKTFRSIASISFSEYKSKFRKNS